MARSDKEMLGMIVDSLTKQSTINEEQTKTLNKIGQCLIRQEESLKYHIKRTDLLEENTKILRAEFKPVEVQVNLISKVSKIMIGILGGGAALVAIINALS